MIPNTLDQERDNALKTQIGGDHYKNFKIQPIEFIMKNNLNFLEGCIIKRICRWKNKGGIEDLKKIKHEVDLLIELEHQEPGGNWTERLRNYQQLYHHCNPDIHGGFIDD